MSKQSYIQAADAFLNLVRLIRPNDWETAALGSWSVRDLVGHTSRALLTVEQFAATQPESITLRDSVDYYLHAFSGLGTNIHIAERGVQTGKELGPDPLASITRLHHRVMQLLESLPENHSMDTRVGGIRLSDYLPSRTTELLIHSLDLSSVLAIEFKPPGDALKDVLLLLADLAIANEQAMDFMMLACGRKLGRNVNVLERQTRDV